MWKSTLSKLGVALQPTAVVSAAPGPLALHTFDPLDHYAWRSRPLVIVAPDETSPELAQQRAMLERHASELSHSGMAVIEVVGGGVRTVAGPDAPDGARHYRHRLGVHADAFAVVLLGKDGTARLESNRAVPMETIFAIAKPVLRALRAFSRLSATGPERAPVRAYRQSGRYALPR